MDKEAIITILSRIKELAEVGDIKTIESITYYLLKELQKSEEDFEKDSFKRDLEHGTF